MIRVPVELENAVRTATAAVLGEAALATAGLARAVVDRSLRYTSERDRLAQPTNPAADLAARAAFFTIADAMKIAVPIAELVARNALPATRPLRVVDLGAGCGAMSLGLLCALDPSIGLAITAIDNDQRALSIAERAIRDLAAGRVTLESRVADVVRGPFPAADLVVMGTVLNELSREAALAVVERALATIPDHGAVIIIEPALRDTSRVLHEIRDTVIGTGAGHVFAPCTRRSAPCTALIDPDDWCHEDRAVELPPQTAALARLTHLRDNGLKFSYLVLRKQPLDLVEAGCDAWRLVSAQRIAKGKLELIGCSERGRVTLRLLKRNRASATREVERADRGDVLAIDTAPGEDRVEITVMSKIERIHRP